MTDKNIEHIIDGKTGENSECCDAAIINSRCAACKEIASNY